MTKTHNVEAGHDHDSCIETALDRAERICSAQDLRFTALRRRVLEIVWEGHKPVGAYDILERLSGEGRTAAPPTVYRALDFLMDAGLVHRLDSLNAFIGCPDPSSNHSGQFLICEECRAVVELDDEEIAGVLKSKAESMGFSVNRQMMEIQGLCESCRLTGRVA